MYYFRDCYFDNQVAFGETRASLARRSPYHVPCRSAGRRPTGRKRSARSDAKGSALDIVAPIICVGVTFYGGLLVLDVLGLEHLVVTPSFDGLSACIQQAHALIGDAAAHVPTFVEEVNRSLGI